LAKVKDPLHSVEARGSVAGVIYNTSRAGKYAKSFTAPVQRRTARQLEVRGLLLKITRKWQTISSANRSLWNAYATQHPQIDWAKNAMLLSGHNWYVRCNVMMQWMMGATVDTPPATPGPDTPAALVGTGGAGQISVAWTPYTGTDKRVLLWIEGPMSPGRVPKRQQAKHNSQPPGETSPYVISNLGPGFYAVFAQCMDEDNGLTSSWALTTATVT